MTTQLFLRTDLTPNKFTHGLSIASVTDGSAIGWWGYGLATTRGSGFTNVGGMSTVSGPTNGVDLSISAVNRANAFISPPLDADLTISGTITFNFWASESSMNANAAINARVFRVPSDGSAWTEICKTARSTELGTAIAVQNFTATPTSTAFNKGDRIAVIPFIDDGGGTMASGFTVNFDIDGTSAAADGDSYVTFNETFTVAETTPAGTTIYPTTTAASINPGSADERVAWTSRGSGTTTAVTNTASGPTAGIQVTATAGGTALEWYTEALAAMTLSGPVLVNLRMRQSSLSAKATFRCEIAKTDGSGGSVTVWGTGGFGGINSQPGTSEAGGQFLVSGDDLSIAGGDRLRIRVYLDDGFGASYSLPMELVTGFTATVNYAGTSGGASGDTYLTFTDTLSLAPADSIPQLRAPINVNQAVPRAASW